MKLDTLHARRVPFDYISPAVCDFIFSASGEVDIFLSDRSARSGVTGLAYTYPGGAIRLQWDTYPGALCYSVYKLVNELDPTSGYVLVAECVTDTFIDVTDPGAYAVTAIDDEGETPLPETPFFVPPPTGSGDCTGNQAPVGVGIEEDACENVALDIDVSAANADPEGQALAITEATVDFGSVVWAGLVLTYTPPADFFGDAVISYVVADSCGAETANAVLVHVWDAPEFTVPDLTTCDDTPLDIDVDALISVGDAQSFVVTEASVDVGGSASFVGNLITFTPTMAFSGPVVLTYKVQGSCGVEYESTANIEVACDTCDLLDAAGAWTDVSTAGCAALNGTASASGNNNSATASASMDSYAMNLLFDHPECAAADHSDGRATITVSGWTGDDIDCRCVVTIATQSGNGNAQFIVVRNGSTTVSQTLNTVGVHNVDFTIVGSGAPIDIDFYCVAGAGEFNPVPPGGGITGGQCTVSMTVGPQP